MVTLLLRTCRLSYEKRQRHAKNAAGRKLLQIISRKQSNLAVAADVATIDEMLSIADQVSLSASQGINAFLTHTQALHKPVRQMPKLVPSPCSHAFVQNHGLVQQLSTVLPSTVKADCVRLSGYCLVMIGPIYKGKPHG